MNPYSRHEPPNSAQQSNSPAIINSSSYNSLASINNSQSNEAYGNRFENSYHQNFYNQDQGNGNFLTVSQSSYSISNNENKRKHNRRRHQSQHRDHTVDFIATKIRNTHLTEESLSPKQNENYLHKRRISSLSTHLTNSSLSKKMQERSLSAKREKLRFLNIDDELALKSVILECFLERSEFFKNVCTVCAKNKAKIDEFSHLRNLKRSDIKKSISQPTLPSMIQDANANCNVYLKHRTRCFFTSAQLKVAQIFKSNDADFDNKLTFKEFYRGMVKFISKEKNRDTFLKTRSGCSMIMINSFYKLIYANKKSNYLFIMLLI